ncbi:MAG: hypothetical protein ACNI27_06870 [Desulfovibrio sp.]
MNIYNKTNLEVSYDENQMTITYRLSEASDVEIFKIKKQKKSFVKSTDKTLNPQNIILLIVESPHSKEYSNLENPKAVQGATGTRINKNFIKLINKNKGIKKELTEKSYRVLVVNPVKFPASCFLNDAKRTKTIWNKLWNKVSREQFIALLSGYKQKPSMIINACTGGRMDQDVLKRIAKNTYKGRLPKFLVQRAIYEVFKDHLYQAPHPCTWDSNTIFEKTHKP